jgi:SAM-dependent methyltransferase
MPIDYKQESEWWDAGVATEERVEDDHAINIALRWRELERHLGGVKSVLDVGGGTGRFSIPLAERGFRVTHLDFAPKMLDYARAKAEGKRLSNITFTEGVAADLSCYPDRSFDLVLNQDGAIAFSGEHAEAAVRESCRVAGRKLIISTSNRGRILPVWAEESINTLGRLTGMVYEMLEQGTWDQGHFPENAALSKGCRFDRFGPFKAFLFDEVRVMLEAAGMRILRLTGLGSLCHLCNRETIAKVLADEHLFAEFVELAERFDLDILPYGPGSRARAGIIAVAEPEHPTR